MNRESPTLRTPHAIALAQMPDAPPPKAGPLEWQQLKKRWHGFGSKEGEWRLGSKGILDDPYAQFYELMRRHSQSSQEPFFLQFPDARWIDLSRNEKQYFVTLYWRRAAAAGLGPAVQFVSPFIYFDCTMPLNRILADLKKAIRKPPSLMCSQSGFGMTPPGKRKKKTNEKEDIRRTPQGNNWEPTPHPSSSLVRYELPAKSTGFGGCLPLTERQVIANLRTFLDAPPADFRTHRGNAKKRGAGFARAPQQDTIALYLMESDCRRYYPEKDLKWLLGWLSDEIPKTTFPSVNSARQRIKRCNAHISGLFE